MKVVENKTTYLLIVNYTLLVLITLSVITSCYVYVNKHNEQAACTIYTYGVELNLLLLLLSFIYRRFLQNKKKELQNFCLNKIYVKCAHGRKFVYITDFNDVGLNLKSINNVYNKDLQSPIVDYVNHTLYLPWHYDIQELGSTKYERIL